MGACRHPAVLPPECVLQCSVPGAACGAQQQSADTLDIASQAEWRRGLCTPCNCSMSLSGEARPSGCQCATLLCSHHPFILNARRCLCSCESCENKQCKCVECAATCNAVSGTHTVGPSMPRLGADHKTALRSPAPKHQHTNSAWPHPLSTMTFSSFLTGPGPQTAELGSGL